MKWLVLIAAALVAAYLAAHGIFPGFSFAYAPALRGVGPSPWKFGLVIMRSAPIAYAKEVTK